MHRTCTPVFFEVCTETRHMDALNGIFVVPLTHNAFMRPSQKPHTAESTTIETHGPGCEGVRRDSARRGSSATPCKPPRSSKACLAMWHGQTVQTSNCRRLQRTSKYNSITWSSCAEQIDTPLNPRLRPAASRACPKTTTSRPTQACSTVSSLHSSTKPPRGKRRKEDPRPYSSPETLTRPGKPGPAALDHSRPPNQIHHREEDLEPEITVFLAFRLLQLKREKDLVHQNHHGEETEKQNKTTNPPPRYRP